MLNKLASAASECMQNCINSGVAASDCSKGCFPLEDGSAVIKNPALGTLNNQTGFSFLGLVFPKIVTLAIIIGALVFFFTLITGAIQWISSGGDKQSLESARSKITNALVGLVILFAMFALIKLIERFFGISILSLDIASLIIR